MFNKRNVLTFDKITSIMYPYVRENAFLTQIKKTVLYFSEVYTMINRAALKTWAKDSLKDNWGIAIGSLLIYAVIVALLGMTGIGGLLAGLVAVGYYAINLSLIRTRTAKIETFISSITDNFGTKLVSTILMTVFTMLWSMLFFIPGIVKSYSYAMTPYLLLDRPELSATDAITESRKMMNGHKMELFLLDLSFIGWMILVFVTFGIASLYVTPYMNAARTAFYETLKGEAK